MNQPRRSIRLVSFAIASLAAVACGHDVAVEEPAGTTQTTSGELAAAPPGAPAEGSSCSMRSEAPAPAAGATFAAHARHESSAAPRGSTNHKLLEAIALAAGPDESPLDEAIKTSVRGSGQNATSPPVAVDQVTTTSATVARGPAGLASSSVAFSNRLPGDYKLERVRMIVDGVPSYDGASAAAVHLAPGAHVVQVIADYRLSDPVFSYVQGYRMEVQTTKTVAASSSPQSIVATAVPTGGVTTPMNKRATLAWQTSTTP